MSKEDAGSYFVFAIGKDRGCDSNFITYNPADRVATCINLWVDVLDDSSPSTIAGKQWHEEPQQKSPPPRIGRRDV